MCPKYVESIKEIEDVYKRQVLNDTEDVLTQIVRINIDQTSCPRYVTPNKIKYRQDQAAKLVEEYHADGIIYEQMKFC